MAEGNTGFHLFETIELWLYDSESVMHDGVQGSADMEGAECGDSKPVCSLHLKGAQEG